MTDTSPLPGELGRGPLGRATLVLHRVAAITAGFVLASAPAVLPTVLLQPSVLTTALGVLLLAAVAVGLSAAITAWRDEARADHPRPWAAFWRGYRRNAGDVVRVVAPALVLLTVVVVSTTSPGDAGIGTGYAWLLIAVAFAVALVTTRAVVIASFFSFRTRDVWRLAVFTSFRRPVVTVALLALLLCAVGVVWILNEAVLLLLGGVAARVLLHYETPIIDLVRDDFTHEGQASQG